MADITNLDAYIPFAPDLAVEVISPNDRDDEVEEKIQLWLKAGSLLVWSVDPESRTVVVYRPGAEPVTLDEDQEIDGGNVIPGFHCRGADFFA
jgi:Uma2 family endonuclease